MKKFERIRNLREDKDLTQQQMADHLNITQRTYSRYENGERSIPIETLIEIANYHDTSIDYLLGLTNNPIRMK